MNMLQPLMAGQGLILNYGLRLATAQLPRALAAVAGGVLVRTTRRRCKLGSRGIAASAYTEEAAKPAASAVSSYAEQYPKATLTVNGKSVQVPKDVTILEAT